MKNVYNAPNKEVTAAELDNLEKKWGGKYPYAILSWRNSWDDLTVFFHLPLEIRKIIYTTDLIENLNGQNQKVHQIKTFVSLWRGCKENGVPRSEGN